MKTMSDLTDEELSEAVVDAHKVGIRRIECMAAELQRHRSVMKRLEFWAEQLEESVAGVVTDARPGVGGFIAQELRNRINGV
jgi:hypothetical protein